MNRIVPLFLLLAFAITLTGCKKKGPAEPSPTPKIAEKVNTIPVELRPYARIAPDPAKQGRGILLFLSELKKPAGKGEYEIEYQTNGLLQGAFGRFKLTAFPESHDILLGSCSAGGKCTYHENVTGGSLLLRFDQPEKYVLKNDWTFVENKAEGTAISSRDGKFSLDGAGLAKVAHFAILQTPGLPKNPETKVLSGGYSVGSIAPVAGKSTVTIRLNEDATEANILGWDGKDWVKLPAKVADKTATATAPKWFEAYVVVDNNQ